MGKFSSLTNMAKFMRLGACLIGICFALVLVPQEAKAAVTCQIDTVGIDFGTSTSAVGGLSYTCNNTGNAAINVPICLRRGTSSAPGNNNSPRLVNGTGDTINFQLYKNAAFSTQWTRQSHISQNLLVPANGSASSSFQFYGNFTDPPPYSVGQYLATFTNSRLGRLRNSTCRVNRTAQYTFTGEAYILSVPATIAANCTVNALGPADLGAVVASLSSVSGSTAINVNCLTGTPYFIGLRPSNNNTAGAGILSGTGGNTDQPPYQLRSVSAAGAIWGDTATVTNVGNGVGGIGNGNDQSFPVFVTLPDTNYVPDSYNDTVTVTINF